MRKHWRRLGLVTGVTCAALSVGAYAGGPGNNATMTFTKDVAPIFYSRCVECHRQGEVAPMSLVTYKDARPWARSIKEKVVNRAMPPWLADPRHGEFENDRRLSQKEIDTIAGWVDAGAPKGEDSDLPRPPQFAEGWALGKPDAVIYMQEEFSVPADGVVPYMYFTSPTNFKEDKWLQAAEIRPGNRGIVHHIIVNVQDPAADNGARAGENQRGEGRGVKIAGFAPGEQPKIYPKGAAKLIKAGSSLVFQLHYTPNGEPGKDRSYIGLYFAKGPVQKKVQTGTAMNAQFVIPAGVANHEVKSSWVAKEDVYIVDLMPHMHVRGKDFIYTAVYPDGRSEVILSVPRYDFNWQLLYRLKKPVFIPKGGRLDCVAHFDNSLNNKFNPDSTKEVRWGPQTWEEMMIGWFDYVVASENLSDGVAKASGN